MEGDDQLTTSIDPDIFDLTIADNRVQASLSTKSKKSPFHKLIPKSYDSNLIPLSTSAKAQPFIKLPSVSKCLKNNVLPR